MHTIALLLVTVARAFFLFAPLLVAVSLSAVVVRFDLWRFAKRPIDGGASFGGRRVFGDSKTWRGVLVAVVGGAGGALLERAVPLGSLAVFEGNAASSALFGAAMGLGAMIGELPNSFVKRRLGIAPGKTARGPLAALFYVWDQIDLLTGAWPLMALWVKPTLALVVASFVLALVVHPLVSLIGWLLGARRTAR